MTEQENIAPSSNEITPYQEALNQFTELEAKPYSPTEYLNGLVSVQTAGMLEGIDDVSLFTMLEGMAGTAANRAKDVKDKNLDVFSKMQEGYTKVLKGIKDANKTSRPKTGIAAG